MSFFRRAGAAIARIFQSPADPAAEPDKVMLYGKDAAGVSQLFARSDDGTVHQLTPPGGGGPQAVIFDDSVPAARVNIRSARASNQSPIDNTKAQITNLGSADATIYPAAAALGARGVASTISGGDDNAAVGDYSSVAGGSGNWTDGAGSHIAGGRYNYVFGDYGHAEGFGSDAEAESSHAEGNGSFVDLGAVGAHAEGGSSIGVDSLRSHTESSATINDTCVDCHAEGDSLINNGSTFSHAEGVNTTIGLGVRAGHVEGDGSDVLEDYGHAEGQDCIVGVGAFWGHAEGVQTQALGAASHAEGDDTLASGNASHAEGVDSEATGAQSHAEGFRTFATGNFAHAEGWVSIASGPTSHAQGILAHATREGQFAHASGSFQGFAIDEGNAQTSIIVMREETTGLAINEAVALGYGVADPPITKWIDLEDSKTYDFTVTATIGGRQAGPVAVSRTIKIAFSARKVAGVSTIAASGAGDAYGDASTATWTLTPTIDGANRVVLTFNSGAGAISKCLIAARVEMTEVRFQPT